MKITMAAVLLSFAILADAKSVIEIHVALDGHDHHGGTRDQPVKTMQRAQELIRNHRFKGKKTISVQVHPGRYELDVPLALTPEDSGSENSPII